MKKSSGYFKRGLMSGKSMPGSSDTHWFRVGLAVIDTAPHSSVKNRIWGELEAGGAANLPI